MSDFLHHHADVLPELVHRYGLTHHRRQAVLQYAQVVGYLRTVGAISIHVHAPIIYNIADGLRHDCKKGAEEKWGRGAVSTSYQSTNLLVELGIVVPIAVDIRGVPYLLRPVNRLIRRGGQHEQFVPFVGQKPCVHL